MGVKTLLPWRLGTGAKANEGVALAVQRTKNSIGYVEFAQATRLKLATALIQNRAGQFVTPEAKTFQTAAASAEWAKTTDFNLMLTDAPRRRGLSDHRNRFCPHAKQPASPRRSRAALSFFKWALEKGGREAASLGYVPLPPSLVGQVKRLLVEIVPRRIVSLKSPAVADPRG